jgi:hypothetical protein
MSDADRMKDLGRGGAFARPYLIDGAFRELLGLCRGALADRRLVDAEIDVIARFVERHPELPEWPALQLLERIEAARADGYVDDEERLELMVYLERLLGGDAGLQGAPAAAPTQLAFTDPVPMIEYLEKRFVLTGTFLFGPRRVVKAAIEEQGGRVTENVSYADYLIIGETATAAWMYGSFGQKIEAAVHLVQRGHPLAIVAERDWSPSLS